jgi:small conductance mechanosensitive channel
LANPITHLPVSPQTALALAVPTALHVMGAVAILIVGVWLSGKMDFLVGRLLARSAHVDEMLRGFFGSIARYFVLTITVLAVLSQFGIQTTSLVAVIGAASLAIGLALQGTLSNLAAGVMLLIFRPFRIGHHIVVGGNEGIVKQLSLFWTEIVTAENVQVIIPNGSVWGQPLKNLSTYEAPVATTELRIPVAEPGAVGALLEEVAAIVSASPAVEKSPAPSVLLDRSPADNGLQLVVTFAPHGDAAVARSELIQAMSERGEVRANPA